MPQGEAGFGDRAKLVYIRIKPAAVLPVDVSVRKVIFSSRESANGRMTDHYGNIEPDRSADTPDKAFCWGVFGHRLSSITGSHHRLAVVVWLGAWKLRAADGSSGIRPGLRFGRISIWSRGDGSPQTANSPLRPCPPAARNPHLSLTADVGSRASNESRSPIGGLSFGQARASIGSTWFLLFWYIGSAVEIVRQAKNLLFPAYTNVV